MPVNLPVAFGLALAGAILVDKGAGKFAGAFTQDATSSGGGVAGPLGLTGALGGVSSAAGIIGAPAAVAKMLAKAQSLTGRPYIWGGGHSTTNWLNAPGYDCSGFVSAVLGSAGFLTAPQTTQTLPSAPNIANGPGTFVTIYDNTSSSNPAQDHVILNIAGQWFESGGGAGLNPSGGVARIAQPPATYLSEFNRILHPVGL